MKSTFFLFLCIIFTNAQDVVYNVDLPWFGGVCHNSCGGHSYSCSNGYGLWNGGMTVFKNPDTSGKILTKIKAQLYGSWSCYGENSTLELYIQFHHIGEGTMQGNCICSQCDQPFEFIWEVNGECFPNYNYAGYNTIQVVSSGSIACLTMTKLELTFSPNSNLVCLGDNIHCGSIGGCNNGTCSVYDDQYLVCDCPENYYGPNCQCNINSDHLETDLPPVLNVIDSGFNEMNVLTLHLQNSVKYYHTDITFKNSLNEACDYPFASDGVSWLKYFNEDTCENNFVIRIPWTKAWPKCVFRRTETEVDITFDGEMIVTNYERLDSLSNNRPGNITRKIESRIPFSVVFPNRINVVYGGIDVYANVSVLASIIEQSVNSDLPISGKVQLVTSVQHPFRINNGTIIGDNSKFLLSVSNNHDDCDTELCNQYWDIKIFPLTGICNLNGLYTFEFTLECSSSTQNNCPLDENTNTGYIIFILESEHFCPQIVEKINIFANLQLFQESEHLNLKSDFLLHQTVYIKLGLISTEGTIVGTQIKYAKITFPDWSISVLLDNYSLTIDGHTCDFQVINNVAENYIQFYVDPSIFDIPEDKFKKVTITFLVDVEFLNTNKRDSEHQYQSVESLAIFRAEGEVKDVSASTKLMISKYVLLFGFLYTFFY